MKREIKFRGRRIDNGEWVYGYLVVDPKGQCKIYWKPFQAATSNTYHIIDPETVGQYTGLKDKNGVEVYENDSVKWITVSDKVRTVEFLRGCFCITWGTNSGEKIVNDLSEITVSEEIEVIGNVFENPELL